jgi:hypothetical protein
MKSACCVVSMLVCATLTCAGVTRYVAREGTQVAPYTSWATAARSIQLAVSLSGDGDEVVVSNGVYIAPVSLHIYSNIYVHSLSGPQVTIIDGSNDHCCIFVSNASNAVVEGFTLRRGFGAVGGAYGGGAYLLRGGELRNCIIRECFATNGAGVFLDCGGSLVDCTIEQNTGWYGGGVHFWYAPEAVVSNCVIRNNVALDGGGGAFCRHGGTLVACTITNNASEFGDTFFGCGGGVLTYYGGVVSNCVLSGNRATDGGGVYCMYGGLVKHCMIRGNRADGTSGGSSCSGGGVGLNLGTVIGCTITGNVARGHAGGVFSWALGDVRDSVICGNSASNWGGGAMVSYGGSFSNCVFGGNLAEKGGGAASVVQAGYTGMFLNCIITGNLARANAAIGGGLYLDGGLSIVRDSLIAFNTAFGTNSAVGGGISYGLLTMGSKYIPISRCTIIGNLASGNYASGGGIKLDYGIIDRCIVSNNVAVGVNVYGGGILCGALGVSGADVISSLVVRNTARGSTLAYGGGVYNLFTGLVANCTICDNVATGTLVDAQAGGLYDLYFGVPRNCIVYFNGAPSNANIRLSNGCLNTCATPLPGGTGNIADNPGFAARAAGDYRLLASSPCVDTGSNMPWMAFAEDLDGHARLYDDRVDMGAYEFVPEPAGVLILGGVWVTVAWRRRIQRGSGGKL